MSIQHQTAAEKTYDALARGDFDAAVEHLSDRVLVLNVATGDVYRGPGGFLEFERGWTVAFPDLRRRALKWVVGDERVVVEYELEGRQTGPIVTPRGHVPPTGMEIQLRFCDVLEFEGDEIAHIRSYFDSVSLLRQLGLLDGSPLHVEERRAPLELYAQTVESHAPQRNKAVVQRFLQDVFNRQNPGAAMDTCAGDYAWHGGTFGEARGLNEYQNVIASLLIAFPDLHIDVLDIVAENDRVVVRFVMTGTHLGDFQGIAPTFRRIHGGGTNTYRFEHSRIAEEWWGGDVLAMLQQMDAAPPSLPIGT